MNCTAEGFSFEPLAFHCWSGLGPVSSSLINRLIKQIAGDAQGWRKNLISDSIRHAISAALMKFVAAQLSVANDVAPRWTLPESMMADLLADQPAVDAAGDAPMTQDLPPDPFTIGAGPPRVLCIAPAPAPPIEATGDGDTHVIDRAPVARPAPLDLGLLPAALSELNPEYEASFSRVGMVVSVRPAFEPVAARTRGRSSHQ